MGIISNLINVRVCSVAIVTATDEECGFLFSTIDGFKERCFIGVYQFSVRVNDMSTQRIAADIQKVRSMDFYRAADDCRDKITTECPPIQTQCGIITFSEFTQDEYDYWGRPKQWPMMIASLSEKENDQPLVDDEETLFDSATFVDIVPTEQGFIYTFALPKGALSQQDCFKMLFYATEPSFRWSDLNSIMRSMQITVEQIALTGPTNIAIGKAVITPFNKTDYRRYTERRQVWNHVLNDQAIDTARSYE